MALKWGNTYINAVKWGSTNITAVYWGSTKVWPSVWANTVVITQKGSSNKYTLRFNSGMTFAQRYPKINGIKNWKVDITAGLTSYIAIICPLTITSTGKTIPRIYLYSGSSQTAVPINTDANGNELIWTSVIPTTAYTSGSTGSGSYSGYPEYNVG
jgi:hypothetical protein